jgi:hypothetical protein
VFVGLAALAVALETVGFLLRLNGAETPALSMDAAWSLPRLFVALLFAAAALLALAGARSIPGRRTWWTAVSLVGAGIAAVKAGSSVHVDALDALGSAVGGPAALALSMGLAAAVIGGLWFLSRHERRDRRRVLGALTGYAVAAVVLSAVSAVAGQGWSAAATFVEESGEALAGVAFLLAVVVGVAPRLALPAGALLRRDADAHTLDLPEQAPGRVAPGPTGR